ncbi:MAG: alpha-amylase family glycosyl hydrolase [Actinomycetota bacterium]
MRAVAGLVAAAMLAVACTGGSGSATDEGSAGPTAETTVASTSSSTTSSTAVEGPVDDPAAGPVAAPIRHPFVDRSIYFVMTDRFENGDSSNDTGGLAGGPLEHGFLPTDRGFHHGGDLAGLIARLDYIAEMGFGAIWITPPFANRFVQGDGTIEGSSSSYHGYWQIDWDRIDPHLGTDDEMRALVAAAGERGIAVVIDAVVNHTGDVIAFAEDTYVYRSTSAAPFLDADGNEFDPAAVAGSVDFPALRVDGSFPYTPVIAPDLVDAKSPAWLNDPTLYHNRGNTTFDGESNLYGDFFGLDDLFTEHPAVVEGMTEIYGDIIDRYGIAGYRVDTMKHVDIGFWESWTPAVLARAEAAGLPDFFIFGEVSSSDPILGSTFTNVGVPSTLDFGLDVAIEAYVAGGAPGSVVADAYDEDDWFTDADNNASMRVTFFGNHDAGRMGAAIARARPGADDAELVGRMALGFDLLFLSRGVPVVYYGDEQGFTGDGGDQLARQSMFPSATPEYLDDDQIGTDATPADDNFDPTHPLYQHVAGLNRLRAEHPALVTGAHVVHEVDGPLVAFSRLDRDERVEYVVVTNANGSLTVPARFQTLSPDTEFRPIRGDQPAVTSDEAGEILVEVPPLTAVVLRAETPVAVPDQPAGIDIIRPDDGTTIPTARYRIEAAVNHPDGPHGYAEVTFAASVDGADPVILGVDDAPPYRVYWDTSDVADGVEVELIATVDNRSGALGGSRATVTMGARP